MLHRFTSYYYNPIIALIIILQAASCSCNSNTDKSPNKPQDPPTPPSGIDLQLSCWKDQIEGQEPLQLKIVNNSTSSTQPEGLQLMITRTEGTHASIAGAKDLGSGKYELKLEQISSQQSISRDLTILGGDDRTAKFTIQLTYLDQSVGKPIEIIWKRGLAVALREVKYDKDTENITGTLENIGTHAVRKVQVKCISKTSGIKFNGKELQKDQEEVIGIIDELPLNGKQENHYLGKIEFGTNPTANLEFTVVYEGGKMEPISHTFTAKDIQLSLAINYDEVQEEVTCIVKNSGTDQANKVELTYQNTSFLVEEQKVLLNNLTNGKVDLGDIAARSGSTPQTFLIDSKGQRKASFTFKVICDGVELTQLSQTETFDTSPIGLTLGKTYIYLQDGTTAQREVKVVTKQEPSNKPLSTMDQINQLKIAIVPLITTQQGYLSIASSGNQPPVHELVGAQCVPGKVPTLYICPQGDVALKFNLQLYYKDKPVGQAIPVIWKAKPVELSFKFIQPTVGEPALINTINLPENSKSIKLQITAHGQQVDLSQIKLDIQRTVGDKGTLFLQGSNLATITGDQMGGLDKDFELSLNTNGDENLEFKLTLSYQGKIQHVPIRLTLDKTTLTIGSLSLGPQTGYFAIKKLSPSPIDPTMLDVEITSTNGTIFTLLKKSDIPEQGNLTVVQKANMTVITSTKLNLLGYDAWEPIWFQLIDNKGQEDAQITIRIKKDGEELTKRTIDWHQQSVDIDVSLNASGYLSKPIHMSLVNLQADKIPSKDIKVILDNPQGLTISNDKKDYSSSDKRIEIGLDKLIDSGILELEKDQEIGFNLHIKEYPANANGGNVDLTLINSQGKPFYNKALYWVNPEILKQKQKLTTELSTLQYFANTKLAHAMNLHEAIKQFNETAISYDLESIISLRKQAQAIKEETDTLVSDIKKIPNDSLVSELQNSVRQDIVVPTENIIEKIDEFLANFMKVATIPIQELLQAGNLKGAVGVFIGAEKIYASFLKSTDNEEIIKNIYTQLVDKLNTALQAYSNIQPYWSLHEISNLVDLAKAAKELGKVTQPFFEKDNLTKIAKNYIAALDKLQHTLDQRQTDDKWMLEQVKELTKASTAYVDSVKVQEVTTQAYVAVIQLHERLAKLYQQEFTGCGPSENNYADRALEIARDAAQIAQEAQSKKITDPITTPQITQAVQAAYQAAVESQLAIVNFCKEQSKNPPEYRDKIPQRMLQAIKQTVAIVQEANSKGFSLESATKQNIKQDLTDALNFSKGLASYLEYKDKIAELENSIQQLLT